MIRFRSSARPIPMVWLLVAALSAMLLVSCSSGDQTSANQGAAPAKGPQTYVVAIHGLKFEPPVLTVKPGDTVRWENQDIVPHNAVSRETKEFDTGTMAVGASSKYEASNKGTFFYSCTLHPNMRGRLVVQ